jgi:hypothetical protein
MRYARLRQLADLAKEIGLPVRELLALPAEDVTELLIVRAALQAQRKSR